MAEPVSIAMYADLACPSAYMSAYVLPSGKQISNVGLPDIALDPHQPGGVRVKPALGSGQDCLEIFRQMVAEARQTRSPQA